YEVAVLAKYNKQFWAGLTYRKGSSIGLTIGTTAHDKLMFSYTYEVGGSGMAAEGNGTHDFSVGYVFGKEADISNKQPYYKWVDN
ncbi:MAG: type IX secretion system membrane protein PorP/SprF, partial [Bacteroidetes bacterium]|nr:type IX secretion system membrane protein PorP/SprF [Bacteroidota bacterium]